MAKLRKLTLANVMRLAESIALNGMTAEAVAFGAGVSQEFIAEIADGTIALPKPQITIRAVFKFTIGDTQIREAIEHAYPHAPQPATTDEVLKLVSILRAWLRLRS